MIVSGSEKRVSNTVILALALTEDLANRFIHVKG